MRASLAWVVIAASGCSLVYDDDFRAAKDLRELQVTDIEVLEGQLDVPILITGRGIAADATMSFELANPSVVSDDDQVAFLPGPLTLVAGDGTAIARSVDLPVMTGLAAGDTTELVITVTQEGDSGRESGQVRIPIVGLDELTISVPNISRWTVEDGQLTEIFTAGDGALDHPAVGRSLTELYSRITLGPAFAGIVSTEPLRLRATGEIRFESMVMNAGANGDSPGPGGCSRDDLECGGSSRGFTPSAQGCGGTGAGHARSGANHLGAPCAMAEQASSRGNRYGVPLLEQVAAPGGEGSRLGQDVGGVGGHGGGLVELAAGRIGGQLLLGVGGGRGQPPPGILDFENLTSCDGLAGAGGGGAGGVLLLRGRELDLFDAELSVSGGSGIETAEVLQDVFKTPPCWGRGGADGYLRIDGTTSGTYLTPATRGPSPVLVGGAVLMTRDHLGLVGSPALVPISIDDSPPVLRGSTALGVVEVELEPGIHEICTWVPYEQISNDDEEPRRLTFEDVRDLPEAKNCIRVAAVNTD